MYNIEQAIKGRKLILTIDLGVDGQASKSGKSTVIASTEGNVDVEGKDDFRFGLNVYRPK